MESLENNNLGDQTDIFEIAVDADRSPGSGYENAATYLVSATILDNDTAGYILVESGESTEVGEGGASDTYELSLTAIPNETVTIDLSASEDIAVNPAQIVFTANAGSNWNQPQTVTVSAVDDDLIEETENTTITHAVTTNDTDYQNAPVPDVPVVVNDNEEVAVNLVPTGGVEGGDLGILEGEAETFAIALSGEPTAPVTFDIASTSLEEAAPTPERLTIAPADWDQPRIITVQNTEDDVIADDTATLTVHRRRRPERFRVRGRKRHFKRRDRRQRHRQRRSYPGPQRDERRPDGNRRDSLRFDFQTEPTRNPCARLERRNRGSGGERGVSHRARGLESPREQRGFSLAEWTTTKSTTTLLTPCKSPRLPPKTPTTTLSTTRTVPETNPRKPRRRYR